jgi:hypothetical protein
VGGLSTLQSGPQQVCGIMLSKMTKTRNNHYAPQWH